MKTNKFRRSTIREIHSMHGLQLEKARVKMELMRSEDNIKTSFRRILSAFSLRNIFSTVTSELTSTSSIISNVFTLGKSWLSKRKKKKKDKELKAEKKAGELVSGEE